MTVTDSNPLKLLDCTALPAPAKLCVVPAFSPAASLSKPPVRIFGSAVGRVTPKASVLLDDADYAFVAAYVSLKLTVRISPMRRAR